MGKAVTSIKIDENTMKEARVQAIYHDMQLSQLIEKAIQEWIKRNEKRKND